MIIQTAIMMDKKKYIKPQMEELQLVCDGMVLKGSAISGGDGYVSGEGDDQLSDEYRSDWENIWANMQSCII